MTIEKLKSTLEGALKEFSDNSAETRVIFSSDSALHKALGCVYEDVAKCLSEFEKAIIAYESEKN